MTPYTIAEAGAKLGLSPNGVRYRIKKGELKGRRTAKGWRVYLNGDEPAAEKPMTTESTITDIADEMIALGRRLKRAIKEHDAEVARETIVDFANSIAEAAERGR